ncbi:MAG TPA: MFS transporter [Acidobacteriota bacterium]|nr:MFS transporter [Acidobacteriota bacterium]
MATAQQQIVESASGRKRIVLGLVAVFLTYFAHGYFIQILIPAMPRIAADLNGMHLYSWGISIPHLGQAFAMLMVGKLSDLYGRRALLVVSLAVCLFGTVWSALSTTFLMLIIARTVLCIGQGALAPLCFSVLGDTFEPIERSRWAGLLNIPAGIFAFIGPTLGGWFADNLGWRYIFWCGAPLVAICLAAVLFGLPRRRLHSAAKIDTRGALFAAIASSAMILAFSLAGTMYPWASMQVIGLLAGSVVFGALFLKNESGVEEPILDLQVLQNRSVVTISSACVLSAIGMIGIAIYFPLMMQGTQGVSATLTGKIITPSGILMGFLGVPTGFILARTKRYKWMYVLGYGLAMIAAILLVFFKASTPAYAALVVTVLSALGIGAMPTINTLVVQYAVPKKLLGVATSALFFFVMMGQSIAPAILGSAMNTKYNSVLKASIPAELAKLTDQATMTSLGNPRVLLSQPAMAALRETLDKNQELLDQTVWAIRTSMESSLRLVFIIGAVCMLLAFLTICTIPEISIDAKVEEKKPI